MKRLSIPMLVSIVAHASVVIALLGVIRFLDRSESLPLTGSGGGRGSVFVEIVGDGGAGGIKPSAVQKDSSLRVSKAAEKKAKASGSPSVAMTGPGAGPGGPGAGSGPSGGTNAVLAEIRARIERAKRYPLLLRKSGVQGVALVGFRIDAQGQPEAVSLKSSSGSPALDEEALATVRRAAPYPVYEDPLTLGIRFELR